MLLDGTILNADVNASAAIAGTKISPDFGSQTIVTTGVHSAAAGTAAAPSITFTGDLNTGIYSPGADQVAISTNGVARLTTSTTAVSSSLAIDHPLGAVGTPSITFTGDLNTGFYSPAADTIAASTGGSERTRIDSSGRLLVGTSNARTSANGVSAGLQVEGLGGEGSLSIIRNGGLAYLTLGRSGGGSIGSNTAISNNDELGRISWAAADGTNIASWAAQISAAIDGTPGSTDVPGRLVFSTTADGAASPTERMRLTSAGLLGLGTSSPTNYGAGINTISINGSAGGISDFYFNGTRQGFIGTLASNQMVIDTAGAAIPLTLRTNNNAALTIDTSQRVGIGTTSPAYTLDCRGTIYSSVASGTANYILGDSTNGTQSSIRTSNNNLIFSNDGSNERARIDSSGRLLVGTSSARSNFFGTTLSAVTQTEGTGGATGRGSLSVINNDVSNNPPYLLLGRSGAATLGSNAAVVSGSRLGTLTFQGADGTSFIEAATVAGEVDGTPGTNDMPGRLVFSTTADGAASPTERMRINNSGSLLVGTSTAVSGANIQAATSLSIGGLVKREFSKDLSLTDNVATTYLTLAVPGGTAFTARTNIGGEISYVIEASRQSSTRTNRSVYGKVYFSISRFWESDANNPISADLISTDQNLSNTGGSPTITWAISTDAGTDNASKNVYITLTVDNPNTGTISTGIAGTVTYHTRILNAGDVTVS
jgi:hypothetical protein